MLSHVEGNKDDLQDIDLSYNVDKPKKVGWQDRLLLNRPLKVITVLILVAIVAPVLIYRYLFFTSIDWPPSDGLSFGSCLIPRQARLFCGYGNVTANKCHIECCYDYSNDICFHRFPSRFSYVLNDEWTEEALLTPRIATVPFGSQRSFRDIRLSIDEVSATHLTLTFYKSDENISGGRIEENLRKYEYNVSQDELSIIVNATQGIIFDTTHRPLIASKDIWEMAFKITNESMYGLGEIPLKEDTVKIIYSHEGGLSSVPLIFAKSNGSYHGLLIDTPAPTEINIRSGNQLVVRSITNFGLKFHLFVGPKPVDIMKDVMKLIGTNKKFEYWMLGAHICSESGTNTSLADLQTLINTALSQNMPFESHCGTVPAVFSAECDDEYVKLVKDGATALRKDLKKYVPHVSPYISYSKLPDTEEVTTETTTTTTEDNKGTTTKEKEKRCFDEEEYEQYIIRDPKSEQMYFGVVDDHYVIYPKYDNVSENFMHDLWVYDDFDGVVLENTWPLDESKKKVNETHLFLPYFNKNFEIAFNRTPQWNATRPDRYLYTHNEYGNQFVTAFEKMKPAVPILSTSQWLNGNVAINRQGIKSSWSGLHRELVEASLGGISGYWFWSSPICGDTENFNNITQIRLCAKWYMAATYFPMIKIHSKEVRRDPLAFVGTDRTHMITALKKRTSIMPYLYSVLQEGPLLRPMFYQFPSTDVLANLTTQFSVGDDLLIVPNLQPSQSHVHFWMPPGQWFEFWGGLKIEGKEGEAKTMTTTEAEFLTLIRAGSILIKQEDVKLVTSETQRISEYTLIIALDCVTTNITEAVTEQNNKFSQTENTTTNYSTTTIASTTTAVPTITTCSAKGKFHMAPGMTIVFEADANTLTITAEGEDFKVFCDSGDACIWARIIRYISVYGLDDDKNNYDSHRLLSVNINLCDLQTEDEITYEFVK